MEILKKVEKTGMSMSEPIIFRVELGPEIDAGGPSRQFWSNTKNEIEAITKQMFAKGGLQDKTLLKDLEKILPGNSQISSLVSAFSKTPTTNYVFRKSFFRFLGVAIARIMFIEVHTSPLLKIPPELRLFLFSSLQLVLDDGYGIDYKNDMEDANKLFDKFLFEFPYGYNINTILKMLTGEEYRQTLTYNQEELDVIYEMADFEFGEDNTTKYSEETKRRLPFFIHMENQMDPFRRNMEKNPSLLPIQLPHLLRGFLTVVLEIKKNKKRYINFIQDLQIDDLDNIFQKENNPDSINIMVELAHPAISPNLRAQTASAIKRSLKNMTAEEQDKVKLQ